MRERKTQEKRELEGLNRQLEKRLRVLTKENNRLRKMLNKSIRDLTMGDDDEKEQTFSTEDENPSFTCESCGGHKSTVMDLGILTKKKLAFEICTACKHRRKI